MKPYTKPFVVSKMPPLRNAIVLASILLAGCGMTAPRGADGYADFDSLGFSDVDHSMTLSIGPALLRFASRHVDDEPETQALLRRLEGIRVKVYEIDGDSIRVATRMKQLSQKLRDQEWQPVVLIQQEGEQVHMLVKTTDDHISGLTVLASDDKEAVLVNIMGDLRPEMFTDTMAALDFDTPEVEVEVSER